MIFRFTDEQRTKLTEIEMQISELNFGYHTIQACEPPYTDRDGNTYNTREEYEKHLNSTIPAQIAKLNRKFSALLKQFEKDHMQSLKTPAAILEDAMQTASDGMYAAFIEYMDGQNGILADGREDDENEPTADDPQQTIEKTVYIMPDYFTTAAPLQPFAWNYAERIDALRGTETTPPQLDVLLNQPFCFDETGCVIWLNNHVIKRHEEMLKGTPEHEELPRLLFHLVDNLPFTENATTSEYWQKLQQAKEIDEQAKTELKKAPSNKVEDMLPAAKYTIITAANFENALDFSDDEKDRAHLVETAINEINGLTELEDGQLSINGRPVQIVDLENIHGVYDPNDYNLPLLKILFGFYFDYLQMHSFPTGPNSTEIAIPKKKLFEKIYSKGGNKAVLEKVIQDMQSLSRLGVMFKENSKRSYPSYYTVVSFHYYDSKTDSFHLSFSFFNKLIAAMQREAIQTKKNGEPVLNSKGEPYKKLTVSTLIHPDMETEKNHAAVRNVEIIIQVIEKTGNPKPIKDKNGRNTGKTEKYAYPHITAKELIRRNVYLKQQLNSKTETKRKNEVLKRCFLTTWDLLREKTDVLQKYPDIQLPKRSKIVKGYTVPTMKSIEDGLLFTFRHTGAVKGWTPQK